MKSASVRIQVGWAGGLEHTALEGRGMYIAEHTRRSGETHGAYGRACERERESGWVYVCGACRSSAAYNDTILRSTKKFRTH